MNTLRWGLLGTAHINRHIIPALRAARRASLAVVASRGLDRAQAYASEWTIPRAVGSYEDLLRDPEIDAVYLPLPNALHVEWTLRALDAGKHVLCEKPLALSAEDVDRIAAVAAARERVVAEAFMYRHEPAIARVRELIAVGAIGHLRGASSGFYYQQQRDADVRLRPELGGGSLWDVGCYPVNAVRFIAGSDPVEVFGWSTIGPTGVDDAFIGLMRFRDGFTATVQSSFRAAPRTWLEIYGEEATIRVSHPFKPGPREEIEIARVGHTERITIEGSPLLFVRQIEDFTAAALDGRQPAVTLADSRGNAAAIAALHASAQSGMPVTPA